MALRRRVLPDTNVCFPISLLDLILSCDEAQLHEVLWTNDLLDELAHVWVREGARSRESADRICSNIRTAFADQEIYRHEYEHLISAMSGNDPDDHVHAAAAASRAPITIITNNVRHFPAAPLSKLGVEVRRPDDYFVELFNEYPGALADVVSEMASSRRNPTMTRDAVRAALSRSGLTQFAASGRATR